MIDAKNISRVTLRFAAITLLVVAGGCARDTVTGSISTTNGTAAIPRATPVDNTAQIQARPGQTRVALLPASAPSGETQVLTDNMARMLALNGFFLVTAPQQMAGNEDLYFVEPVFDVTSGEDGRRTLEVAWIIADSSGDTLGKIAQRRRLDGTPDSAAWQRTTALGAAAAAEGVSRIIREQRNL